MREPLTRVFARLNSVSLPLVGWFSPIYAVAIATVSEMLTSWAGFVHIWPCFTVVNWLLFVG